MTTTEDTQKFAASESGSDVAARLQHASFVHLLAHRDGDSIAASGLLARALETLDTPYQLSPVWSTSDAARRIDQHEAETTCLSVGLDVESPVGAETPASLEAFDIARDLDATPDPVLALAGIAAAGHSPGTCEDEHVLEAGRTAGLERRPGIGIPVENLADGLAHSTLLHTGVSGDSAAAQAMLTELDLPMDLDHAAHRDVASLLALDTASPDASELGAGVTDDRGVDALERALRPLTPGGPFATIEGFGDVLDALTRVQPALAVALALGSDGGSQALEAWRAHGMGVHTAIETAATTRHSGLLVAQLDATVEHAELDSPVSEPTAPVWATARLLAAFDASEPHVLTIGDGRGAFAGPNAGELAATLGEQTKVEPGGTSPVEARFEDESAFVQCVREAV